MDMNLPRFAKSSLIAALAIFVFFAFQLASFVLASKFTCEELLTAEELAFADKYMALLREGKFEEVSARLKPELKPQMAKSQAQMMKVLEKTSVLPRQFVGCQFWQSEKERVVAVSFQWASESTALLGNLRWKGSESPEVQGVNIELIPDRLENIHSWHLLSKSAKHWAFFLLSMLIPAFILYTLVSCWRADGLRRRWAWMFFISLGFWQYTLNWTTGEIAGLFIEGNLRIVSILILGGSIARSNEFTPFLVSVSLPLGALLYWARKCRSEPKKAE
jgi:hypothetical protein